MASNRFKAFSHIVHTLSENKRLRQMKVCLGALSICVFLLAGLSSSFAWLMEGHKTDETTFSTDGGYPMQLSKTVYQDQNYIWTVCQPASTDAMHPTTVTELENLEFGTIDHVGSLNSSNYVFLRVKLDGRAGSFLRFGLYADAENPFTVTYQDKTTGNPITLPENGSEMTQLKTLSFLTYGYAFSGQENADVNALNYTDMQPIVAGDGQPPAAVTIPFSDPNADPGQIVYLYLKIQPDLQTYIQSLDVLTKYMPCSMAFALTARFDVAKEETQA